MQFLQLKHKNIAQKKTMEFNEIESINLSFVQAFWIVFFACERSKLRACVSKQCSLYFP